MWETSSGESLFVYTSNKNMEKITGIKKYLQIIKLHWLYIVIVLAILFCILENELNIIVLALFIVGAGALITGNRGAFDITIVLGIVVLIWYCVSFLNKWETGVSKFDVVTAFWFSVLVLVVKEREENDIYCAKNYGSKS
jgi:hypothetical protein